MAFHTPVVLEELVNFPLWRTSGWYQGRDYNFKEGFCLYAETRHFPLQLIFAFFSYSEVKQLLLSFLSPLQLFMFEVYSSLLFPKQEQQDHSSVSTDVVPLENLDFFSHGLPLSLMAVILGSINSDICIQSKRKFELLDGSVSPRQGILTAFNFLLQVPCCCSFSQSVWAKAANFFCTSMLLRTFSDQWQPAGQWLYPSTSYFWTLKLGFLICPDTVAAPEVLSPQVCITCNYFLGSHLMLILIFLESIHLLFKTILVFLIFMWLSEFNFFSCSS